MDQFSRTRLLVGNEGIEKLSDSKVAVFGLGGVGSYTVEALARAGIGTLILVDFDDICVTNINRQLQALHSTVGRDKAEVLAERIGDINPKAQVIIHKEFITAENAAGLLKLDYSYVVDAVDNVTAKLALIQTALGRGIPVVSAMGAGNRLDPTRLRISDIQETEGDPLARVMRRELKKRGIVSGLKVVYSTEPPLKPLESQPTCKNNCVCSNQDAHCAVKRQIPGSISVVPSVAGLFLASQVIRDLLSEKSRKALDVPEKHDI